MFVAPGSSPAAAGSTSSILLSRLSISTPESASRRCRSTLHNIAFGNPTFRNLSSLDPMRAAPPTQKLSALARPFRIRYIKDPRPQATCFCRRAFRRHFGILFSSRRLRCSGEEIVEDPPSGAEFRADDFRLRVVAPILEDQPRCALCANERRPLLLVPFGLQVTFAGVPNKCDKYIFMFASLSTIPSAHLRFPKQTIERFKATLNRYNSCNAPAKLLFMYGMPILSPQWHFAWISL